MEIKIPNINIPNFRIKKTDVLQREVQRMNEINARKNVPFYPIPTGRPIASPYQPLFVPKPNIVTTLANKISSLGATKAAPLPIPKPVEKKPSILDKLRDVELKFIAGKQIGGRWKEPAPTDILAALKERGQLTKKQFTEFGQKVSGPEGGKMALRGVMATFGPSGEAAAFFKGKLSEAPGIFKEFMAKSETPAAKEALIKLGVPIKDVEVLAPRLGATKTVPEVDQVLNQWDNRFLTAAEPIRPPPSKTWSIKPVEPVGFGAEKLRIPIVSKPTGYNFEIKQLPIIGKGATKTIEPYYAMWTEGPLKGKPMGASGKTEREVVENVKSLNQRTGQNAIIPTSVVPKEQIQAQIDLTKDLIKEHPGTVLKKIVPDRIENTNFLDKVPVETATTRSEANKIMKSNAVKDIRLRKLQSAFEDTKYSDQFDNYDVIKQQKAEVRGMEERLKQLKVQKKEVPFMPKVVQPVQPKAWSILPKPKIILPTPEGKSLALIAKQEGYNIPKEYEIPKEIKLSEDVYKQNRIAGGGKETIKGKLIKYKGSTAEGADKILGVISTRLKNLNPILKREVRGFEYKLATSTQKDFQASNPFMKGNKKMPKSDNADLDLALKNSDTRKINEIISKNNLQKEYEEVKTVLEDLYKRATDIGYEIPYRSNYFPRQIKDAKKFMEYLETRKEWKDIDKIIREKEIEFNRYLTIEEKAAVADLSISPGEKIIFETGAMKPRTIEIVSPELNKFYTDSNTALNNYIQSTNDAIESWKFFRTGTKRTKFTKVDDAIGSYVLNKLADGTIKPIQAEELTSILKARFKDVGTRGIVSLYKNLSYIDTMGSPISAITQIGDLGFSIYRAGLWRTGKEVLKSVLGKSEITRADIGIDKIAQEFSNPGSSIKLLSQVFKSTGLEGIDAIGKEALINSIISKYRELASGKNIIDSETGKIVGVSSADFTRRLENVFGNETAQVVADLKSGQVTENVKYLAFNELLDVQPIKLSEMPEQYLSGGNGRIFYMLKTYTIKLFDVYRNEVFQTMKRNKWEGIRNLLLLSGSLVLANATADEIKDFILGRKTSLKDRTVDNLLRLVGFTKWTIWQARKEGLASATVRTILPPTNLLDSVYKDIAKGTKLNELETIRSIPFFGKLYYYWFGKGAKKEEKKGISIPEINIPEINIPDININIPEINI